MAARIQVDHMSHTGSPIRVAIVNDYPIVVVGLAAMLQRYLDRIKVVELQVQAPVRGAADIVLYDAFASTQRWDKDIPSLVRGSGARLVIYGWTEPPHLMNDAHEHGASGFLSKQMSAEQIVEGLEAIHAGASLSCELPSLGPADTDWPGRDRGLSPRESEVVALVVGGLSNQEIADNLYLSINSVKTYIRTAYRKIGVTRRPQAVLWGLAHGFIDGSTPPGGTREPTVLDQG